MADKPQMVDMSRTPEDIAKAMAPAYPNGGPSQYPGGLCICLTQDELSKLGLEGDCEVGDMLHLFAMAKVTNISRNASESSENCRIELQITHLAVEDEDDENAEARPSRAEKRYGKEESDAEDTDDDEDDEDEE